MLKDSPNKSCEGPRLNMSFCKGLMHCIFQNNRLAEQMEWIIEEVSVLEKNPKMGRLGGSVC